MASTLTDYITNLGNESRTITSVVAQTKRPNRVSVFVDGEFAFGVSEEVAVRYGLRKGTRVRAELLRDLDREENVVSCKRTALRYISYRMRSEAEIRRRLAKDDTPAETIDTVVEQLKQAGVVDDLAFAEAYGRDAVVGRKWGPHRIARGLRLAGVGDSEINEALSGLRHTLEDEDVVMTIGRKRWNQLERISDPQKRKKRLYDYLARRGFDFDEIRRVLDELTRS